jgi:ABC-type polysaccharide/polyol phosphate export permease/Flp pilus assembly protein TadD
MPASGTVDNDGLVIVDASDPVLREDRGDDLRREFDARVAARAWTDAAEIAVRLADASPREAVQQRVASGYLLLAGKSDGALRYAQKAVDLDETNAEYALHLGVILNASGDWLKAVPVLLKSAQLDPSLAEIFQQLAFASEKLGHVALAAQLAVRAHRLEPASDHRRLAAAHFLALNSRFDDAITTLRAVGHGESLSATSRRTLSGFLGHVGDYRGAVEEIDAALRLEPLTAEYHLHRSWLLAQLARWGEALEAVRRAMQFDPANRVARRHAVTVLAEMGDLSEAVRHGGELLAEAPDEEEYVSCMRHLIEVRSIHALPLDFGAIASVKASALARPPPAPRTFGDAVTAQGRSIGALVLRDIRSRYGESRLGFFWSLLEPFLHVGVLAIVFQFTMHGSPPLGDSFFFFYFTGVMPYLLVSHLILHVGHSVRGQRQLLQIPTVAPMDVVVAKAIVEIFSSTVIFAIFLGLFAAFGVDALPVSFADVLLAFSLTAVLGFGLGMLCAALFELGTIVEHGVGLLVRLLYFASGIFYVPAIMPVRVREIVAFNPFLHIIDLMRVGFFRSYAPEWLDVGYAAKCSLLALLIGMAAVTVMSRRMRLQA